jgi:protein kinase X
MNGGFKPSEANFYFANMVCAIGFLHNEGIVHCDVKPDNILLGPDGYLCLTDFGSSAKLSQFEDSWTEAGTVYYMAPECQVGAMYEPREFPEAIDWWSSGCVLYEMLTGMMAFFHSSSLGTQYLASQAQFEWPPSRRLGKNMRHLVESLLVVAPEDRLGSNGSEEVQSHPWLSNIDWSKMKERRYLAPFTPKLPDLSKVWHKGTLPMVGHAPGITIAEPRLDLVHDDRFPANPLF